MCKRVKKKESEKKEKEKKEKKRHSNKGKAGRKTKRSNNASFNFRFVLALFNQNRLTYSDGCMRLLTASPENLPSAMHRARVSIGRYLLSTELLSGRFNSRWATSFYESYDLSAPVSPMLRASSYKSLSYNSHIRIPS